MSIARVQSASASDGTSTTSLNCVFGAATTAGNWLFAVVEVDITSPAAPTISGFTALGDATDGILGHVYTFYKENCGAATTYAVTLDGGQTFTTVCMAEYSGLATGSSKDGSAVTNNGTASNPTTGNYTSANANDLLIYGVGTHATALASPVYSAPSGGFSIYVQKNRGLSTNRIGCAIIDQIVSSASTYNSTVTDNEVSVNDWGIVFVGFQQAVSITNKTDTDSGTLADATATVKIPATDTATLAESQSQANVVTSTDTASMTSVETVSVHDIDAAVLADATATVILPQTDAAVVSEAPVVVLPVTDAFFLSVEIPPVNTIATSTDAAVLSESMTVVVVESSETFDLNDSTYPVSAVGTGSDAHAMSDADLVRQAIADSGVLGETSPVGAVVTDTDSAIFLESSALTVAGTTHLNTTDSAHVSEAWVIKATLKDKQFILFFDGNVSSAKVKQSIADSMSVSAETAKVRIPQKDAAVLAESSSFVVKLTSTDSGHVSEVQKVRQKLTDAATVAETIAQRLKEKEAVKVSETQKIAKVVLTSLDSGKLAEKDKVRQKLTDSAVLGEAQAQTAVKKTPTDTATLTEVEALHVVVKSTDAVHAADANVGAHAEIEKSTDAALIVEGYALGGHPFQP